MKVLISAIVFMVFITSANANTFAVDFAQDKKVITKKDRFTEFMMPFIKKANEAILAERAIVADFFTTLRKTKSAGKVEKEIMEQMLVLAEKYNIESVFNERLFKKRVAPIPASLALTQAAIETGWGSSRFFKEANNAFGQWTYGAEGMIPNRREQGKTHRIRTFDSVQESVDAYMLNLNRNDAYSDFRNLRYILGGDFNGLVASTKMINYSQQKEQYVTKLRTIMTDNKFLRYD